MITQTPIDPPRRGKPGGEGNGRYLKYPLKT